MHTQGVASSAAVRIPAHFEVDGQIVGVYEVGGPGPNLPTLPLRIDLYQPKTATNIPVLPTIRWTRTQLTRCTEGVAELPPTAPRDLAASMNCPADELTDYLTRVPPSPPRCELTRTRGTSTVVPTVTISHIFSFAHRREPRRPLDG